MRHPHICANREEVRRRVRLDYEARSMTGKPSLELFQRTVSYAIALLKSGCRSPRSELTVYRDEGLDKREIEQLHQEKLRRGHDLKQDQCEGRLQFDYDAEDTPFIS